MDSSQPSEPQHSGSGGSKQAAADDATVFRQVYPKLLAYAAVVADPGTEAGDLVQDALVTTLRSHRLADLDYPQAYLRRAILSAAIGRQRKAATFHKFAPELVKDSSRRPDYPSDLSDLDHLDPRDRAILYLVYVEGCSYAEVAELTDESVGNARRRASQARKQLQEAIAEEAAGPSRENDR